MKHAFMVFIMVFSIGTTQAWAGSFDFGLGLGFVNSQAGDAEEFGWDLIAGYEGAGSQNWHTGGQLHLLTGNTNRNDISNTSSYEMTFDSTAFYATARSKNTSFDWLQFKAGVVSANFKTNAVEDNGVGMAVGAGIVVGAEDDFRWHILDVQKFVVANHHFWIVSVSLVILLR